MLSRTLLSRTMLLLMSCWCLLVVCTQLSLTGVLVTLSAGLLLWYAKKWPSFLNSDILFGLSIPLLPLFGSSSLLLLASVYLLLEEPDRLSDKLWLLPYLLWFFAWAACLIWFAWDNSFLQSIGENLFDASPSLTIFLKGFLSSAPYLSEAFSNLVRLWLAWLLLSSWSQESEQLSKVLRGLGLGLFFSVLLTLSQVFIVEQSFFPNFSDFWASRRRFPGTFSDPNAFGISTVLLAPYFMGIILSKRIWQRLGGFVFFLVWLFLSSYAGSRSMFLGLGLFVVFLFILSLKQHTNRLSLALSALTLFALFGGGFFCLSFLDLEGLPSGVLRVLHALDFSQLEKTFYSRSIFWELAFRVWGENILLGAGPGQFAQLMPRYAVAVAPEMGLWSDNANNFYLQLGTELGLVGMLLFLGACLFGLRRQSGSGNSLLHFAAFLSFVVLLFLGPHLHFDEVAVLLALCAALSGIKIRDFTGRYRFISFLPLVLLPFLVLAAEKREYGGYHWETLGEQEFRWTRGEFQSRVRCVKSGIALELTAAQPDIERHHLDVIVSLNREFRRHLTFRAHTPQKLVLDCEGTQALLQLKVSQTWTPEGPDFRYLGVKLAYDRDLTLSNLD